jgi:DNA (cytosine-5)-methyltransferase 1
MKYLSVCSGVEAATVAWHDFGWNPVAFSEIEKFPSEVLKHRYPTVPNLGDMTKYKEWNLNEPIDLLVGGTPCQSFSVAGLRKGLEDPRGNLMLTYVGLLDKFKPKWCVWENVPGVLSSNGGRDFGSFLGALVELGYGFAYRVLDAQHFGVPQRRRRVFVVGCFGDWISPAKVLFEPESLCGDNKKSKSKKQSAPAFTSSSFGGYGEGVGTIRAAGGDLGGGSETLICTPDGEHTTGSLLARDYKGIGNQDLKDGRGLIVYENHPSDSRVREMGSVCSTVVAAWGTGGGNVPFALAENTIGRKPLNGGNGTGYTEGGPMYTLNATGVHGVAVDMYNLTLNEKTTQTLRGFGHIDHVGGTLQSKVYSFDAMASNSMKSSNPNSGCREVDLAKTLDTFNPCPSKNQGGIGIMQSSNNMAVRRLTPMECERLQGFPDDYTNIKEKCPDGPRYKAMGNSMAVPVMKWIGQRIKEVA